MTPRVWLRTRADLLMPAAAAASLAALLVWFGPPGTDLAAHVYQRTLFLEHGFVLWNNFWYAGRYSFVTYSVLYYPLAAAIGIKLLAVLIVAVAVAAFAAVVRREWGEEAKWSIRAFAVVWALLVVSAAYPFMLGSALALVALWFLQLGRRPLFAGFALLTLAASPLAFALLVVLLAAVALARRDQRARLLWPSLAIAAVGALELVLRRMFPGRGTFPFSVQEFLAATVFCVLGIGLTWGIASARVLRWTYIVYFAACTAAFAFASPIGENIARLRFAAAPIAILTLTLRHWRPRPVCAVALALALSWNLTPLAASFVHGAGDPTAHAAYWKPTISYLQGHVRPSYRVEAVDTRGHWPADFLARARIPLARGWFRQEDFPQNRVLYGKLGPVRLRELAAQAQRPLRRAHDCDAGLQRACRSTAAREWPLGPRSRPPDCDDNRLRRSVTTPARQPAGTCARARLHVDPHRRSRGGHVPARRHLRALLAHTCGLPEPERRRHDGADSSTSRHRLAAFRRHGQASARRGCRRQLGLSLKER